MLAMSYQSVAEIIYYHFHLRNTLKMFMWIFYAFLLFQLRRWIPNPGVPSSKPLGGSKVDSAFHPAEVDKVSTRNFRGLSGKK